ncbi:MAG: hypothetical protein EA412_07210 [Chitinophagaceae bacterium]|nr:MAG: hypothetical protein EA412_07210 [Chitinophagaceae bacterium]
MNKLLNTQVFQFKALFLFLFLFSLHLPLDLWSQDRRDMRKTERLPTPKHLEFILLSIPEPSGITMNLTNDGFFIVSDDGYLYETNLRGDIIRKSSFTGIDFEAVYVDSNFVYVVEESNRRIRFFDHENLSLQRTVYVPYSGGRNKGFESFTYNHAKSKWILITEKDPIVIFELNHDFQVTNKVIIQLARDISDATWYDDSLWLLSDEDRKIIKVNPLTYMPELIIPLRIINPEGLVFGPDNKLYVISDDMERLYIFKSPVNTP